MWKAKAGSPPWVANAELVSLKCLDAISSPSQPMRAESSSWRCTNQLEIGLLLALSAIAWRAAAKYSRCLGSHGMLARAHSMSATKHLHPSTFSLARSGYLKVVKSDGATLPFIALNQGVITSITPMPCCKLMIDLRKEIGSSVSSFFSS